MSLAFYNGNGSRLGSYLSAGECFVINSYVHKTNVVFTRVTQDEILVSFKSILRVDTPPDRASISPKRVCMQQIRINGLFQSVE